MMKQLLVLVLISTMSQAQNITIPDLNFKNALLFSNCVDLNLDGLGDIDADINNDGEIQLSEAEAIHGLIINQADINSLEGIQFFSNVELLMCIENNISALNLTQNTNLKWLLCNQNPITSIDFTANLQLEQLNITHCNLTSLDVSQNSNLKWLLFDENEIDSIDLTNNPELLWLFFANNQLTEIDVTGNLDLERLVFNGNLISTLDVTQNANLFILTASENQISSLDVTQNENLAYLFCGTNQISSLDLTNNPDLIRLSCINNPFLTSLNIQNGNNATLTRMYAFDNPNLSCIQVDDPNGEFPECDQGSSSGWCKDATASYSELCVLGVEENDQIVLGIYPNPVKEILHLNSVVNVNQIRIYSTLGSLVDITHANEIDVSRLETGIYFLQAIVEGGEIVTERFIKD